jgi:ferrochelatase
MAYGTPATPDDVEGYYTDIRRGRPPTAEQLADLVRRYDAIGGISPLGERTEAQRRGIQAALRAADEARFDVVLGMKHAAPSIEAGVEELSGRGVARIVGLVLAPHFSALSVGQYIERAEAAGEQAGVGVEVVPDWHLEPAYLDFLAGAVRHELDTAPPGTKVVFTAHSLPARVAEIGDPYPRQLRETAAAVASRLGLDPWTSWAVAYQSAGRTPEPWLGPDIATVLDDLAASEGATGIVVCPCGFVSDHLEVLYDLDIEARSRAERAGLFFARTRSMNDEPSVLSALAQRIRALAGRPAGAAS